MFGRFIKRGGGQPVDETREFLATLTGSAAAILQQVIDWLEEQEAHGGLNLAMLLKADERLEAVRAEIEENIVRQRRLGTWQKLLRSYCEWFAQAYARIARGLPGGDAGQLTARLRATHLLGRACRLARVFHEDPVALRQACLAQFAEALQTGLATTRRAPYAGMAESSISQETALTLLWETIPFDTLTPEQCEYLERLMTHHAQQIVLKAAMGATAPFAVLPQGNVVPPARVGDAKPILYVGAGPLAGLLAGLTKLPDDAPLPSWADSPLPDTDLFTLKSLAQRMSAVWERKQIQRGSERVARQDAVFVTGGFDNIRRAIAYAAYVRSGGQLDVYDVRLRTISERLREVLVGLEDEKKQLSPLEVLAAMETAGDSKAVETWPVHDSSARGYNLAVPGYRNWLAVGELLALRESNSIDWQVAIVRRLYVAGKERHAGIEVLPGLALPVGMSHEGKAENVSIADLRDTILVRGDAGSCLITPFECVTNGTYMLMGHGRGRYRIGELLHGSASYKVYACITLEGGG